MPLRKRKGARPEHSLTGGIPLRGTPLPLTSHHPPSPGLVALVALLVVALAAVHPEEVPEGTLVRFEGDLGRLQLRHADLPLRLRADLRTAATGQRRTQTTPAPRPVALLVVKLAAACPCRGRPQGRTARPQSQSASTTLEPKPHRRGWHQWWRPGTPESLLTNALLLSWALPRTEHAAPRRHGRHGRQ